MTSTSRTYTTAEIVDIATEVRSLMERRGIARETACRIVGKRRGLTRYQVRGVCIRANESGLVTVPTRPIRWLSTGDVRHIGRRMVELRDKGMPVEYAARIVAAEIGCCGGTVEKRWYEGVRNGRWIDPVTSRADVYDWKNKRLG